MVEVLVTLLVLGIGLLGLAALQITGLRLNDSAELRTKAALAAYDLADRLRSEPGAFFPKGQKSKTVVALNPGGCDGGFEETAVERWKRDFCALGLPEPQSGNPAEVDCQSSNDCGDGNCAILIRWSDDRAESADQEADTDARQRFCTRIATAL